jgi:tRNA pseudouridine13 synthase
MAEILDLPCAHGGPAGRATMRAVPEDFIVREWLGFEPDGDGEHVLLRVRKRDANTMWVAKQLAKLAKIHPRDVGFAGLKDRDAVADQAFTVPARSAIGVDWAGVRGEGFAVLTATRHRRKLKRGALRGNEFEIALRSFSGPLGALEQRLQMITAAGVPNYFGPQRFGRAGHNVEVARAWFSGGAAPRDRTQRSFALSAARALIFNAALAERVRDGTWNRMHDGDVANLDGSGSTFVVETVDEVLRDRCTQLDIHPTGPMWGAGPLPVSGEIATLEQRVVDGHPELARGLEGAGLEAERRALRVRVDRLECTISGSDVFLRFRLARGAFATAVLHELIDDAFTASPTEGAE